MNPFVMFEIKIKYKAKTNKLNPIQVYASRGSMSAALFKNKTIIFSNNYTRNIIML